MEMSLEESRYPHPRLLKVAGLQDVGKLVFGLCAFRPFLFQPRWCLKVCAFALFLHHPADASFRGIPKLLLGPLHETSTHLD